MVLLVTDLISQFTTLIALIIILLTYSWQLTLALVAMAPHRGGARRHIPQPWHVR